MTVKPTHSKTANEWGTQRSQAKVSTRGKGMGTGLTEWYERANIAIRQLRRYNETSGTRKLPGQDAKSLQHSRAGIDAPEMQESCLD